jgi:hypothetical protein
MSILFENKMILDRQLSLYLLNLFLIKLDAIKLKIIIQSIRINGYVYLFISS